MSQEVRVQSPPTKPLLVFDGDCQFCRRWIARWKNATGDAVDYIPFQDPSVASRFPEIPPADFAEAVHLIRPDGSVSRGAEAVFRSLAEGGRHRWLLRVYQKTPAFADLSELLYEEVALHRTALSKLDRIYAGPGVQPPSCIWARFVFLRGLALIYLIAFGSFWMQADGLVGSQGIARSKRHDRAEAGCGPSALGLERFISVPTLAWWGASDSALHWQCGLGVGVCAGSAGGNRAGVDVVSVVGASTYRFAPSRLRSSNFQWDILLLETGFLAIFFAPLAMAGASRAPGPPAGFVLWLLRWLLFRLMFESGCVKLMSGDAVVVESDGLARPL